MKIKGQEFIYWHIRRPSQKVFRWFIWKIPKKIVYWCVIRAASPEKNQNPETVTVLQMLKGLEAK